MTATTNEAPVAPARRSLLSTLRAALVERRTYAQAYRKTYRELAALSDRDLADIGISRVQIGDIATEHAMDVTGRL